jgi:DnaJ family protein C protein 9
MLSNPLVDEERYRGIIDAAIESGEVKAHKAYTGEGEKAKENRMKAARREGEEAEEHAKNIGVHDKLFGKKDGKSGEDALAALIQKRQAGRGSFLDNLEAKYAAQEKKSKGKKSKKRGSEDDEDDESGMPSEEAFQAAAARLKNGTAEKGRKTKRTKH